MSLIVVGLNSLQPSGLDDADRLRGSVNTPHTTDVPLRDIIDLILTINAQTYSIEAANPRHEHEWQV